MAASNARPLRRIIKGLTGAARFYRNYPVCRRPERPPFTVWRPLGDLTSCISEFSANGSLFSVTTSAVAGFQFFSTLVEPFTGENACERIYVQDVKVDTSVADPSAAEVDGGCDVPLPKAKAPVARELIETERKAWSLLKRAVVNYCGSPVGTVAANDPTEVALNYDQIFIRDFVPSAIAFLFKGDSEIVRNFLLHTLQLQIDMKEKQLKEKLDLNIDRIDRTFE